MPEQAGLVRSGVPLDSPLEAHNAFAVGFCLNHAWLSQELSVLILLFASAAAALQRPVQSYLHLEIRFACRNVGMSINVEGQVSE